MGLINRLISTLRSSNNHTKSDSHEQVEYAERLIEQGNTQEDNGDIAGAMRYYEEAVKLAPNLARAHLNRGNVFQAQNQLDMALIAYNIAANLKPDYAGAYFNIGNVNARMERPTDAIAAYQTALTINPHYLEAEIAQGMAAESCGQLENAIDCYRRSLNIQAESVPAHMGLARTLRALGRDNEALAAVSLALAHNPHDASVRCLEGDLLSDLGQTERAIASYVCALEIDPHSFVGLTSLGDAQRNLGHFNAALESYSKAASIHPKVALLHVKLSNTLHSLGRPDESRRAMARAVELDPNSASVHFNAGNLYDDLGDFRIAIAHYRRAIAIQPDAQTYNNLGNVQKRLGQLNDAFASFRLALDVEPDCAEAHCNLGLALQETGQYEQALASLKMACQLQPNSALFHCNIVTALLDLNRIGDAQNSCQRALELDPDMVEANSNMGNVQLAMGLLCDAAASFERALELAPNYTKARHNLSHAQLAMGQLAQGWKNYEYRVDEHRNSRAATRLPQWSGQPVAQSDRILVFVEQGLGDMLQFVRYLPLVAERFPGGVSLYALPPLVSLFRRSFPMITVLDTVPTDESAWQWQCPLLSLPLAFGTVLETIPNQTPYLVPDTARCAHWQHKIGELRLPQSGHKKVGIVWKPGAGMKIAHLKATTLQTLAPLLCLSDCTWFSLQKEPDPETTSWVNAGKLIDWSADFHDFDDTAALAVNLDLIISVDTSVAHLAGGLGLPTWLLNRYASDWRWMREREDSPWYSTLRIFAQDVPGDWDAVAHRVAEALSTWQPSSMSHAESKRIGTDDWRRQGNAALQSGNLTEAAQCYRNGIRVNPSDAVCYSNLGFVLSQLGQRGEAAQILSTAVGMNPGDFDARFLLGNLARDDGDVAQSIEHYRAALQANPDFEYCRRSLCMALVQLGRPAEARALMDERPALDNTSSDYFVFKGNMHLACAEYAQAEAAFVSANHIEPLDLNALSNLGAAQLGKRDVVSAAKTYQRVLEADPNNVAAYSNRATALQLCGEIELAIQDYRNALRLNPDYLFAQQNLLGALTHSFSCTPADYLREARKYGGRVRAMAMPYASWSGQSQPVGTRPLRVGFVSGDLRMHPVGYFLMGVLKCLDRTAITSIAYSNAVTEDSYSERLKAEFAEWNPVFAMTDQQLAEKIHADHIDILVDLAGHTAHNRLAVFAWRAAPVQVSWLGYWASTGVAELDYILVDEISVPRSEAHHFTEALWFLPNTRLCFTPPTPPAECMPSPLPCLRNGYVTFGSFQKLDKISDATLAAWAKILARLPVSRLRLQSRPLGFPETMSHMCARLTRAQIDLARVDILGGVSHAEYLLAYSEVDMVLDTFPFAGGTTTAEALWMGVPTITLAGGTLVARQGESMMLCVGLVDWVAPSEPDYVRLAAEKASDLEALMQLRLGLRDAMLQSPLLDADSVAKDLTIAFHRMCHSSVG